MSEQVRQKERLMQALRTTIEHYERHDHVYWILTYEQRVFVDELIGFFKRVNRLVIAWPFNPQTEGFVDWRVTTPIEVKCTLGAVCSTARISPQEFPLSKDKQEYIEGALKMRCMQEYVDSIETTIEVGQRRTK